MFRIRYFRLPARPENSPISDYYVQRTFPRFQDCVCEDETITEEFFFKIKRLIESKSNYRKWEFVAIEKKNSKKSQLDTVRIISGKKRMLNIYPDLNVFVDFWLVKSERAHK